MVIKFEIKQIIDSAYKVMKSDDTVFNKLFNLQLENWNTQIIDENKINIEEADIEMNTTWIDGSIIFRRVAFESIIKKLEHRYNMEIINNNESLNNVELGANFDIETIEQVFETLNENYNIDYSIKENNN